MQAEDSLWEGECFVFDDRVALNHNLEVGSYDMCHGCRMPITDANKLEKEYVKGVSCSKCFYEKTIDQKKRYADRQKQVDLAKLRNEKHIGATVRSSKKMTLPILYSFRRCPYAMRARMALILASQKCELREILLKNKPDEMLKISPKGTVPVLQLPDKVLDESLDIISWACKSSVSDMHIYSRVEEAMSDELIQLFDSEFKYH